MKRYAQIIGLKLDVVEEYKRIHAAVWPEVLKMISDCNIRNYSIFYKDGLLYAYFEYIGTDFAADMRKMAQDPNTQAWWKITDPMQEPLAKCEPGEWWMRLEEVFHVD